MQRSGIRERPSGHREKFRHPVEQRIPDFIAFHPGYASYMGHLRKKIEEDPSQPKHILTEAGVGYRFVI